MDVCKSAFVETESCFRESSMPEGTPEKCNTFAIQFLGDEFNSLNTRSTFDLPFLLVFLYYIEESGRGTFAYFTKSDRVTNTRLNES